MGAGHNRAALGKNCRVAGGDAGSAPGQCARRSIPSWPLPPPSGNGEDRPRPAFWGGGATQWRLEKEPGAYLSLPGRGPSLVSHQEASHNQFL